MKIIKYLAGAFFMALGGIIMAISFFVHLFLLGFVTYILIDEKIIAGGIRRGYLETIKLGFQYPIVRQWPIAALGILILGILLGLYIGSIGTKTLNKK